MFTSQMMHHAENLGHIPLECYGSWKNHEAIEVTINCHLIVELPCQKCIPGAIASMDAQNGYDCITHVAGSLYTQSFDVDP
jgi:hypothetical protein